MNDQWFLLWSWRQNSVHVEPLEHTLRMGRKSYTDNKPVADWAPIAFGTEEEMRTAAENVVRTLDARAEEMK